MESRIKTLTVTEHARQRQGCYLHCGPQHAFWELFNGWTMLMDFACAGISWEHPSRIDIDAQNGKCLLHVTGNVSTEKVFKLLNKVIAWKGEAALPVEFPSGAVFHSGCIGGTDQGFLDILPLMLVIAYSQNVRLHVVYEKQSIEMTLQGDTITSLKCEPSEEANQWHLDFTPNPQYISEVDIGKAFQRECFRRVCAYSDALTIRVRGHEMREFSGTRTWLGLVAPWPPWKETAEIRVLVPRKFEVAFSFRPGTGRRYEIFCAGHLSGGQPRQLLENVFESYIAEFYGEAALPKTKDLGFVAVLSILGFDDIIRQGMASEDCHINEDSVLYAEIKDTLRRTFRDLKSLHDLLKEEYGLAPIE